MKIAITGSTGFVGTNLISFLKDNNEIEAVNLRDCNEIKINKYSEVVIHLAGKAHDLKKNSNKDEYYKINLDLTINVFEAFLKSNAETFIFMSTVKAVADYCNDILTENQIPNPQTHYGKSKLIAEEYILSKPLPTGKRIFILRPSMIHGPGNKGNLNLLYKLVKIGIPWPLGAFENKRSFCSIDNLCFIINSLIENKNIPSGIYNVADDEALSTNEIITLFSEFNKKKTKIIRVSKKIIFKIANVGDSFKLPLNNERLTKLTENFVVSNSKIKTVLNIKTLPISSQDGMIKTITNFKENN
jgi:nucleoside-diphosphate-sugar epimerase